ncbi:RHS repeat-associated core domain-containing protein [Pontiella sp.]|uniref:RHS repeat-associated core domain-containing protein n=1 Tax=Pontiella sp. TaxID=2837462 RepID=UPI00356A7092
MNKELFVGALVLVLFTFVRGSWGVETNETGEIGYFEQQTICDILEVHVVECEEDISLWAYGIYGVMVCTTNFQGYVEDCYTTNVWVKEGECDPNAPTEEPIDTTTGNNFFTEQRLYVPCPGIPLEFNLKYQSVSSQPEGLMGTGWLHSYEWFADIRDDRAVLYSGEGDSYVFMQNEDGSYNDNALRNWSFAAETNGYVLGMPGGMDYVFGIDGALAAIRDGWENQVDCTYNTNGCLARVEHSNDRALIFSNAWVTAVSDWRVASVAVDGGASLAFDYNTNGQFTAIAEKIDDECYTSTYAYDDGYLTNRINNAGHSYSYGYETLQGEWLTGKGVSLDVDGYYAHTVDYVGGSTSDVVYERGDADQVYRYSRNDNNRVQTRYGPAENTASVIDRGASFTYAANGLDVATETLFDSSCEKSWNEWMLYDDRRNMTNYAVAYGSEIPEQKLAATYDPECEQPSFIELPDGLRLEAEYTNGLLRTVRSFIDASNHYDVNINYNALGLPVSITNENEHAMNLGYDASGNMVYASLETGPSLTNGYNDLGFLIRSELLAEDGLSSGRTLTMERDAHGRALEITYPDSLKETFGYNAVGDLTNAVDRAGHATEFAYAPTHELTSVTRWMWDPNSGSNVPVRVSVDYDKQFNTLSITEPRGRYVESYQLDIQDRVTAITNIENQVMEIEYGLGDFVENVVRFDGSYYTNGYDTAGNLTTSVLFSSNNQQLVTVDMDYYYADDMLKFVGDGVSSITNQYDLLNRLTNSICAVGTLHFFVANQFDPVGNVTNSVVEMSNNGQGVPIVEIGYEFDAAERLTEISSTGSTETQRFVYSYSPVNGLVSVVTNIESGMVCSYAYDLMDHVTNIAYRTANGSLIRSLDYAYDAVSMITEKRMSTNEQGSPNVEVGYSYDSLDRLVHETTSTNGHSLIDIGYSYDLAGNRLSKTADGLKTTYALGVGNRLASATTATTNTLFVSGTANESIGTDPRWGSLFITNLTAQAGVVPGVNGRNFFAEVPATPSTTNTLVAAIRDQAGNMGYATNVYYAGTTESTEDTEENYAYDAAGCLTNLNGSALDWDERYRLKSVDGASCSVAYEYDVLGRRTARFDNNSTNYYVYSGNQIVADLDGSGNLLRTYVWGPGIDNLLAFTDHASGVTYYAIKDHQNSVLALVDENGTVVESYEYTAYGETKVFDSSGNELAASALGNRYTFQGREIDWATGLYYFRARWYDPDNGRWLSKDPIGIAGGLNLYEAFGNNPVNSIDPDGLWNLWNPATWGIGNGYGETFGNSLNPFGSSANWGAAAEGAVGGAAAWVDGVLPFVDPFEDVYTDECGNVSSDYKASRFFGGVSRDALLVAGGAGVASAFNRGIIVNGHRVIQVHKHTLSMKVLKNAGYSRKVAGQLRNTPLWHANWGKNGHYIFRRILRR